MENQLLNHENCTTRSAVSRKKILIVDDDSDTRTLLKKRLEFNGYECFCDSSVESSLERLEEVNPDLVILDLGFKKASGTAFLQNAGEWLPEGKVVPPIIVLSGYRDKAIIDYVMENGAKGFLSKPFNPERLVSMIREHIL